MPGQGAVGNDFGEEEEEEEEAEGVESDSDWLERVKKKQLVGIVNNTSRNITFWRERMMTRREKVYKEKLRYRGGFSHQVLPPNCRIAKNWAHHRNLGGGLPNVKSTTKLVELSK